LSDEYDQYFQAELGTEAMQWDVVDLLLHDMVEHYPQYFKLDIDDDQWYWRNRILGEEVHFVFGENGSLPLPPLDWVGRQVQEDLLILRGEVGSGMPLVAGQLCFPNAWCLDDKMGKSFLGIHDNVPLFMEYLGRPSSLLLERLKIGRPVWRVNWSIKATARLNQIPRFSCEEQQAYQYFTVENVGERCFLRIERQTLSKLPRTGAILFTIHTYQTPVVEVARNREQAHLMAGVLRTTPQELLVYKNIEPYSDILLSYMESRTKYKS
jgi:dimethylamine monooxygenase subunit A